MFVAPEHCLVGSLLAICIGCHRAVRMQRATEPVADRVLILSTLSGCASVTLSYKAVPWLGAGEVIHWRCESFLAKGT